MMARMPSGLAVAALAGLLWIGAPARVLLSGETPEPAAQEKAPPQKDQGQDDAQGQPKQESPKQETPKPDAPDAAKTPAKPALNPQQVALRNRVRRVLAYYARLPVNTADNTPGEVLQFCLAGGCDTEIRAGGASGKPINGFGALCYNYPCAGYEMLAGADGAVMARIGYGLQTHPGEMLAVLALSGVPADYEIVLDKKQLRVADLVEHEKRTCRPGTNLAFKLIGLSFYAANDASWKDELGEAWTIERLLDEEWKRTPSVNTCDVTDHLTALSRAIQRRARAGRPLDGSYQKADQYLAKFEDLAFQAQNRDGGWSPNFFAARGAGRSEEGSLFASGHVLSWLAHRLPDDRLDDPRMVRAVTFATGILEQWSSRWDVTETSPREISAVMYALHALRMYDRRLFKARE